MTNLWAVCSFPRECNLLRGWWHQTGLRFSYHQGGGGPRLWIPKSESNTGMVTYPLCLKEQVTVQAPYGNENWELPDHSFPSLLGREGIKVTHLLAWVLFAQLKAGRSVTENKFLQISGGLNRPGGGGSLCEHSSGFPLNLLFLADFVPRTLLPTGCWLC